MRSDLIYGALAHVENRYQLCQLTSLATRKLHRDTSRVEDTTNDVLTRFQHSNPAAQFTDTTASSDQQHRAA